MQLTPYAFVWTMLCAPSLVLAEPSCLAWGVADGHFSGVVAKSLEVA